MPPNQRARNTNNIRLERAVFAISRAFHTVREVDGNYLRHVRALSSLRTAGSLESENSDSIQMNRNSQNATAYRIQIFRQPSNKNPRCAYTNPPSLRMGHFTYHSDICTKRPLCNAASHFPLELLPYFHHRFIYPCLSFKTARSSQPAVTEEPAPPRELLRLSPY